MLHESPIVVVAAAIHAACLRDLDVIRYRDRDWEAHRLQQRTLSPEQRRAQHQAERSSGQVFGPFIEKERRHTPEEVRVVMFEQTWSSTALGYGGMGGAAMTTAYTVMVISRVTGEAAVYFGSSGRLAYVIPPDAAREYCERIRETGAAPSVRDAQARGWLGS